MKRAITVIALLAATAFSTCAWAFGPVARLQIVPGHISLRPGMTQHFDVYGLDAFGIDVPVTETVTWSTDSSAGTITQDGLYTAGTITGVFTKAVRVSTPSGLSAFAMVTVSAPAAVCGYMWERSWGNFYPGRLCSPQHIERGPDNTLFVPDSIGKAVQQFDTNGNCIYLYGPIGAGKSFYPKAVGFYGGNVIVASDYTVVTYDSRGNPLSSWGAYPQLINVTDMVVDKQGFVYLLQPGPFYQIQKFTASGTFVKGWGDDGSGVGEMQSPRDICIDQNDCIYVADSGNSRIQKFDSDGNFLAQWTDTSTDIYSYMSANAVYVDSSGSIYAFGYLCVMKFDQSGTVQKRWKTNGINGVSITVDDAGNIYLVEAGGQVVKLDSGGTVVAKWGQSRDGTLEYPCGIGVSPDGESVYVSGMSYPVQVYDPNGSLKAVWDLISNNVRVDKEGFVYTAGYGGEATKRTPEGALVTTYKLPFPTSGEWPRAYGVAIAADGDVYVSDESTNKISRFSADGTLISQWGGFGATNGLFNWVHSIALDAKGNVYAVDSNNNRIQKFDAEGHYLGQWGTGSLYGPWGLCISPSGFVFVAEEGADRIQKFTTSGTSLGLWGGAGSSNGKFYGCNDVAVDAQDNVYVVDEYNCRVCKFVRLQSQTGAAKGLGDGQSITLGEQIVTAGSGETGAWFYIEAKDRSAGIKVVGKTATRGSKLTVTGTLSTVDGERVLNATDVTQDGTGSVSPIAMTNKSLGGASLNFDPVSGKGQMGVENGAGANNLGLLVMTTGKITARGADFFYVDDGTHAQDGSGFVGVKVLARTYIKPIVGTKVCVTGISSIYKLGEKRFRAIALRASSDIKIVK